jgi:multidrug efflux pump subunit AcrA (membrane-fusion protein)
VVAKWISDGSPALDRILSQQDLLLQVSFLPTTAAPSKSASIQLPSGRIQSGEFLSAYPTVDSRIQSPSFLYMTPATPELVPGMTLTALLPAGSLKRGVIVPSEAIVWWQGKPWTYVQTAPDRFVRREVSTDNPIANGWFVTGGFAAGQKVVVRGGQQLLSEEFRSQIQVLSEGGGGD